MCRRGRRSGQCVASPPVKSATGGTKHKMNLNPSEVFIALKTSSFSEICVLVQSVTTRDLRCVSAVHTPAS